MSRMILPPKKLIGLALPEQTSNNNGQSGLDCGQLWQTFESGQYFNKIPNKTEEGILAVYHNYQGDHTQPFSYFIGCEVSPDTIAPEGMSTLTIPGGSFEKITIQGQMPQCIANAWREIWASDIPRKYQADFEVYDHRCADWNQAEVDIYLSIK